MSQNRGFFSFLDDLTFVEDDSSRYEIDIGDAGFSYLDMASDKKVKSVTFEEKQGRETSASLDGSTRARGKLNIKKIEAVDHDALCLDTDLEAILRDIQERRNKVSLFPFAAATVGLLLLLWLCLPFLILHAWLAMLLSGILLFPGGLLLLWNAWKLDISRKQVRFAYRFSGGGNAAFKSIDRALAGLRNSGQLLLFTGRRHFEDTRYSGGSDTLPTFNSAELGRKKPPFLDLDFDVWHLRAFHKDIFFMPDHLLVFEGSRVGSISYAKMELSCSVEVAQARDEAKQTADSKVVGHTYRFVNNDGTPDQRFNNNVQVPLIEYGLFSVSGSGLELKLYASRQDSATTAPQGFAKMQQLAGLPVQKAAEVKRQQARPKGETQQKVAASDLFPVLMDALCCVMVADGRASRSEKARIQKLMNTLKAPWGEDLIDQKMAEFVERVKRNGYAVVLKETCESVKLFKKAGKEKTLSQCLDAVAGADGVVDDAEERICERFRIALR